MMWQKITRYYSIQINIYLHYVEEYQQKKTSLNFVLFEIHLNDLLQRKLSYTLFATIIKVVALTNFYLKIPQE